MALGADRRQLNASVSPESHDRVARAARKLGVSKSAYVALFIEQNLDVIDPEGAAPDAATS